MPGHTKCCTCPAKSSWQTWRSDAPKCNPSQEISALTSYVSCTARATRNCEFPTLAIVFETATKPSGFSHFRPGAQSPAPAMRNEIWTSKSAPKLSFFILLTWKCASRHNGVQLFISHLARWLRTRRFSEPTFRPSETPNHWKNTVFRDFPTFSRICIFFLLFFSPLWSSLFCSSLLWLIPPLLFHLSRLSEVWLLNFLWLALEHARMASMVQSGCCAELLMLTAL